MSGLETTVTNVKADKKELKVRIKAGEEIHGANLIQSKRVQIA